MTNRLVVIGNGMAGTKLVEELTALEAQPFQITVFGAEPSPGYNRILLSPVLAGELGRKQIELHDRQWYEQHHIDLRTGEEIVRIDRARRQVVSATGATVKYHRLVLATGAQPIVPCLPGGDLEGVVTFRNLGDVDCMLQASRRSSRAVVIGGGLLGLEAASGLLKRGMDVTVVHLAETLLNKQIDAEAGNLLRQTLEGRGIRILTQRSTESIGGTRRVECVRFSDGAEVPADIVVIAAGIRPNTALARESGLRCGRGILVNDTMQTFDPSVYALGECVEHRGRVFGLVAPIHEQARVCANQLAGLGVFSYRGSLPATSLKVSGIKVFSAGEHTSTPGTHSLVLRDFGRGCYRKLVVTDDRLCGAVLYGDTTDAAWYLDLIRTEADISPARDRLIFGRAYAPELLDSVMFSHRN